MLLNLWIQEIFPLMEQLIIITPNIQPTIDVFWGIGMFTTPTSNFQTPNFTPLKFK